MTTLLYIFILTICASLIQRISGFGFGIFVMLFFPLFLPSYGAATTLSGLLAGSTALIIAIRHYRHIKWRKMPHILICNIIASFIAIEFMATLSSTTLKKCFGAMFILIALYFLFLEGKKRLPQNWWTNTALGSISGIMGGMFAMPGPPIVLYCINHVKEKTAYIATLQAFSVILNIFYTLFRARVGFFDESTPLYWCIGLLGGIIGTSLGAHIFKHISPEVLKKIVYTLLLVSGIIAML